MTMVNNMNNDSGMEQSHLLAVRLQTLLYLRILYVLRMWFPNFYTESGMQMLAVNLCGLVKVLE